MNITAKELRSEGARVFVGHGEAEREGRRVLRKLSEKGLFLVPELSGQFAVAGSRRAGRTKRISAALVAEFLHRDWIVARGTGPETYELSKTGRAWLALSATPDGGFPDRHRLLVQRWVKTADGEEQVTVNEFESPLARMRARKQLTNAQFEAGERLRLDFTVAGLMPRLCADLTSPISNGARGAKSAPITERIIAARQRFRLAMASVGPGLSDLLFDVCCHLKGLERVESANDWPSRSAKVVLQIALDRLSQHYGIAACVPRSGHIRAWRAEEVRSVA